MIFVITSILTNVSTYVYVQICSLLFQRYIESAGYNSIRNWKMSFLCMQCIVVKTNILNKICGRFVATEYQSHLFRLFMKMENIKYLGN